MGRKKKGDLSREQLLKTIDDNTDAETSVRLPVSKPKLTTRVKKVKVPAKVEEEVAKVNLPDQNEWDEDEDVFDDNADEIANEVDELTRLMSCVGIDNDLDELDKQTNLAGLRERFLPPQLSLKTFFSLSAVPYSLATITSSIY